MSNGKEPRPGASPQVGRGGDVAQSGPGPGKRTLTEALPAAGAGPGAGGAGGAKADDAGAKQGAPTGTDGGGAPAAGNTDAAGPGTTFAAPGPGTPGPGGPTSPTPVDPPTGSKNMESFVVTARGQRVQIYVSPGGINHTPDVFMFFHGYYANLGIDPKIDPKSSDNASGEDTAAAAMAQAKALNTLAMLPQGVRGDDSNDGGRMDALQPKTKQELKDKNALPLFIDEILARVAEHLQKTGTLAPNHIGIAGHSAGGYKGVNDALSQAGGYEDKITDITLMDSSYSSSHFASTSKWMFEGSPGKTVRIVQSLGQLQHGWVRDKDNPKGPKLPVDPWHKKYFGEAELKGLAGKHGMTITKLSAGEDRGNQTKVVQHTQVLTADGKVQCDVLIMQSDLGHHEIRDNVMDDAIDSIGQGAQGNVDFGKNQIPDYGRDPSMPHDGNVEPKPAKPTKPATTPKHP
jgi:hypothetical protein